MFQTNTAEEIKTHILWSVFLFPANLPLPLSDNEGKYGTAGQAADVNTADAF